MTGGALIPYWRDEERYVLLVRRAVGGWTATIQPTPSDGMEFIRPPVRWGVTRATAIRRGDRIRRRWTRRDSRDEATEVVL